MDFLNVSNIADTFINNSLAIETTKGMKLNELSACQKLLEMENYLCYI